MRGWRLLMAAFAFGASAAFASLEPFDDPQLEARYRGLLHELRCLVCQNQSLADSNAELAQDLRREVREMLEQGASDQEIIDFMVNRYGEFVLYRPRWSARTVLLWLAPALVVLSGGYAMLRAIRRHSGGPPRAQD